MAPSLDQLIANHGRRLLALLHDVLGDAAGAEDAWQETWFAVWRMRRGWDAGPDPWPLLRRVAINKAIDGLRRQRARPDARAASIAELPSAEVRRDLELDLTSLRTDERAALVLYFWEGLSVGEIAKLLDAPTGTIKTWMRRGRERLRAKLELERSKP